MNKRYKFDPNNPTATYESRNSEQMDALTDQYLNGSYDPNTDKAFQDYANLMMKQGNQAMRDTVARASSMTGGYGNSYAQSAGQQAYNGYLDQIGAAEQSFRSQYNNDLLSKLGLLEQQEARDKAAWESDYAAAYAQAQNEATYGGDYTNLAKFMGTDAETLKNSTEAANRKPLTDDLIDGYRDAINSGEKDKYYARLVNMGYDTDALDELVDLWSASGDILGGYNTGGDGKKTTDEEGNFIFESYVKSNDDINKNITKPKTLKKGANFKVKNTGDGEKYWNVQLGDEITDKDSKIYTYAQGKEGLFANNGRLYYTDGTQVFNVEEQWLRDFLQSDKKDSDLETLIKLIGG